MGCGYEEPREVPTCNYPESKEIIIIEFEEQLLNVTCRAYSLTEDRRLVYYESIDIIKDDGLRYENNNKLIYPDFFFLYNRNYKIHGNHQLDRIRCTSQTFKYDIIIGNNKIQDVFRYRSEECEYFEECLLYKFRKFIWKSS